MLIDEVQIKVKGGKGGNGCVAFQKNLKSLGPTGASGGNGAGVIFEGASDLSLLGQFRYKKEIKGPNGKDGRSQFRDGETPDDLVLKVPVGTVIYNLDTSAVYEIIKIGQKITVASGGHGGKGNFLFRSPINTSPEEFQEGLLGEEYDLRLELKMIADVGFVGLPNVGKSSLLNELTKANVKVANYPFTTLEPNLGVYYELILADIPGLIEGASSGKGLGDKFLRHIERTNMIFHFISSESQDIKKDYGVIRKELGDYNKDLLEKPEYLFLTKSDMLDPVELNKKLKILEKINKNALAISVYDWDSLGKVKIILNKIQEEKKLKN